jgi:hypothetical protein
MPGTMADKETASLTWAEFKQEVTDAGVQDDDTIEYIDMRGWSPGGLTISREDDGSFSVTD